MKDTIKEEIMDEKIKLLKEAYRIIDWCKLDLQTQVDIGNVEDGHDTVAVKSAIDRIEQWQKDAYGII